MTQSAWKKRAVMRVDGETRFWSKVNKTKSCWLWEANKATNGYGMFKHDGKMRLAHRHSYEMNVGKIPDGLCVLHKCDVPACVNPDHLFLGSHKDNAKDKVAKGRHRWGEMRGGTNPAAKLSTDDVLAIRSDNRVQRLIAQQYGVRQTLVSAIKLRQIWRHV